MIYGNVFGGIFVSRPNRFIAHVEINGKTEICHVKNTGRCSELLYPGVKVIVERSDNPDRSTKYDLIAVWKSDRLVNIDSQAPNRAFLEYLSSGRYIEGITHIKPEAKCGDSRFDFYAEAGSRRIFIETKGVTLEKDGVALFPDAPTMRGIKHLDELSKQVARGYEAHVVFIVQRKGVKSLSPNRETHAAFGEALVSAQHAGVKVLAFECRVTENSMEIDGTVPVVL